MATAVSGGEVGWSLSRPNSASQPAEGRLGRDVITDGRSDPVALESRNDCHGWPDSADCTASVEPVILSLVAQGEELSDRLPVLVA